ncbi:hypothetical protein [Gimesia algae]|uniref:Uncharacterized protein n=1 Tax=Gimesia algae TaxID=2527971 RepID=A0A517V8F9_9PLAN|nr:hypothetical protein [Gimesia algae]QDT89295.1 hypothetical protein Pan161_09240 [Gimesia algae]
MKSLFATTRARVLGTADAWRFSTQTRDCEAFQECKVELEIQGDDESRYLLIFSPEGYFSADTWHESLDAAQEEAERVLGVTRTDWTE